MEKQNNKNDWDIDFSADWDIDFSVDWDIAPDWGDSKKKIIRW